MKNSTLILTGLLALIILLFTKQAYKNYQDKYHIPEFQKKKTQAAKKVKCPADSVYRNVQFDYSYIRKTHKEHLVRDYFDDHHCEWKVHEFNMNKEFDLVWVFSPHQINYNRFIEGKHMTNHIQNLEAIVDKSLMVRTLKKYDNKTKGKNGIVSSEFLPETYTLNMDKQQYSNEEKQFLNSNKSGMWIAKPTNLFGGRGIQIVKDVKQLQSQIKQSKSRGNGQDNKLIIQKYIENPFLIEKKKFDIRSYVFIVSTKPKYLALFHHGFIRRTLFNYDATSQKKEDDFVHLTNVEAQKKHPNYEQLKDETLMSMGEFENYFINQAGKSKIQLEQVYADIKAISAYTVQAAQQQLVNKKGFFQILGFDFMLDEDLNVSLIEINKSPSWQIINEKQEFKKEMLHQFIDTVLKINDEDDGYGEMANDHLSETNFEVIYNQYTNYVYKKQTIVDKEKPTIDY